MRVDREPVRLVSQLADELPLVVLNSASFELLLGQPELRRRFMDWGVFHVEHGGQEHRQRFQRALVQRNHLLRRDNISVAELAAWDADLAIHAEAVSASRERFLQRLEPVFHAYLASLAPSLEGVALRYLRGWDSKLPYIETLGRSAISDREQGFTQSGPQRADLRVSVNGYPVADTLSRGQQKLVVCALKLAQGQVLAEGEGRQCVYLVDDIAAELDKRHVRSVCQALNNTGAQTLVTCIERHSVSLDWFGTDSDPAVFHVEQGRVTYEP